MVAETPQAHVQVAQFISEYKPDILVYDVPMPYGSNWDLLDRNVGVTRMILALSKRAPWVSTDRIALDTDKWPGRTVCTTTQTSDRSSDKI